MSADEVEVAWEDLGTEHVGRAVHIVAANDKKHEWGTITRIEMGAWKKTLFLGDGHPFAQQSSTSDRLYFLA